MPRRKKRTPPTKRPKTPPTKRPKTPDAIEARYVRDLDKFWKTAQRIIAWGFAPIVEKWPVPREDSRRTDGQSWAKGLYLQLLVKVDGEDLAERQGRDFTRDQLFITDDDDRGEIKEERLARELGDWFEAQAAAGKAIVDGISAEARGVVFEIRQLLKDLPDISRDIEESLTIAQKASSGFPGRPTEAAEKVRESVEAIRGDITSFRIKAETVLASLEAGVPPASLDSQLAELETIYLEKIEGKPKEIAGEVVRVHSLVSRAKREAAAAVAVPPVPPPLPSAPLPILPATADDVAAVAGQLLGGRSKRPEPVTVTQEAIRQQSVYVRLLLERWLGADPAGRVIDKTADQVDRFALGQLRRVLAIDLRREISGMQGVIDQFREANIQLIESGIMAGRERVQLRQGLFPDVSEVVEKAHAQGLRVEELQARLVQRFGVSDARAELIARDQVLSLNSQVSQYRQQQAGITRFLWSSSRDQRTRPSHRAMDDGTEYEYANPPVVDGVPSLPGQPINCRCVAVPVKPDWMKKQR
jgi:SPP1 gp7 family putative phage head morphogenesis protein